MVGDGDSGGRRKGGADDAPLAFTNPKDLEDWLKTQPKEVSVVIAARAALRVAPLLGWLFDRESRLKEKPSAIILPLWRALAAPRAAAKYPARSADIRAVARGAAGAAAGFANAATSIGALATAAASAAGAAFATVFTAAFANAAATAVGRAASTDAAWKEVNDDVNALWSGARTTQTLADAPLWNGNAPDWALDRWLDFKNKLLSLDEDWDVWTDWYEGRLAGKASIEELEIARLTLGIDDPEKAEELWGQGPKAVNARIKELIAAYWEGQKAQEEEKAWEDERITAQGPAAYGFYQQDSKLAARPTIGEPADIDTAMELHAEALAKIARLSERCRRTDFLASLRPTVDRLKDRFDGPLGDLKVGLALSNFRSFEAQLKAYDTAENRRELSPQALAEMHDVQLTLDDLLSLYPIVQRIQAAGLALRLQNVPPEALRAPLQELQSTVTKNDECVDASVSEALASSDPDIEAVEKTIETTKDEAALEEAIVERGKILAEQLLVVRNFGGAVIRFGADAGRKVARGALGAGRAVGKVGKESLKAASEAIPRGVGKGVEEGVAAGVIGGIAALVGAIAGPFAGIATLVAGFQSRAKRLKELEGELKGEPPIEDVDAADDDEQREA